MPFWKNGRGESRRLWPGESSPEGVRLRIAKVIKTCCRVVKKLYISCDAYLIDRSADRLSVKIDKPWIVVEIYAYASLVTQ